MASMELRASCGQAGSCHGLPARGQERSSGEEQQAPIDGGPEEDSVEGGELAARLAHAFVEGKVALGPFLACR